MILRVNIGLEAISVLAFHSSLSMLQTGIENING